MITTELFKRRELYTALLPLMMAAAGVSSPVVAQVQSADPSFKDSQETIEEVTVTGSYIKRKQQADSTSPVQVIGAENMDDIGAFGAVDVVNSLTVNAGAQNNNDGFNQTFSLGTTNINLRGLGVSSTLTLLNGRRQAPAAATTMNGDQFTDLNSLVPGIAIERVEVLEDGASSLYGSDAVAGVANFITRSDFEGLELDLDYKVTTADSQDDKQLSALWGQQFGDAHVIGAVSYFDRAPLSAAERRDEFELRDANSTFGQPGTFLVFQAAGAPVFTADPSCAAVAANNPETTTGVNPAGFCGFDFGDYFGLVADEERIQTYVELNSALSDVTEFFAEAGYTSNDVISTGSPSQPILFPPFIPPGNPSAAAVGNTQGALFFGRVEGTGSKANEVDISSDTWRLAAGFRGDFESGWSWQAAVSVSENTYEYSNGSDILVDRFMAALAGAGGPNNDQFYNPLYGAVNDPAVREDFRGTYAFEAVSELATFDAHISGEIMTLPAGTVALATGVQVRRSELEYDYNEAAEQDNLYFFRGNDSFADSEDAHAVFVEVDIPVVDGLNVQAALRYEDLGDFDTVDPKLGFIWMFDELSFRGTYGTSFRAPSIFQTSGGLTAPARIFDPVVGGLATISQRTEGDANDPLEAQESDTYNLGVTWSSVESDLTVSLDYWRFEYTGFITPENATAVVAADPFGDQVTRDPSSGALLAVTTFFRNAGALETDGLDLSVEKGFNAGEMGTFKLVADASYILSYDLDDPVLGEIDGKGQRNFTNFGVPMPEWRGNAGFLWEQDNHSANVYVRYVDSYADDNLPTNDINSFTTVDAQYNYDFNDLFEDETGLVLTLGIKNLFDKMPPDVVSRSGYDPLTHNPLGRQVYMSLKATFE